MSILSHAGGTNTVPYQDFFGPKFFSANNFRREILRNLCTTWGAKKLKKRYLSFEIFRFCKGKGVSTEIFIHIILIHFIHTSSENVGHVKCEMRNFCSSNFFCGILISKSENHYCLPSQLSRSIYELSSGRILAEKEIATLERIFLPILYHGLEATCICLRFFSKFQSGSDIRCFHPVSMF